MNVPSDPAVVPPGSAKSQSGVELRQEARSEPPAEGGPGSAPRGRGGGLVLLGAVLAALVGLGVLARHWLWVQIRSEAAAQGVQLDACQLDLGWERLTLRSCQFASSRDSAGHAPRWIFGGARVSGRVDEVEVALSLF